MKLFFAVVRWVALLPLSIIMLILAYLLAPILPLVASRQGWLPAWLNWFQTPDNSLDGDAGWKYEHWQRRYRLPGWLAEYVGRVGWLWRNPAYGFDFSVIGFLAEEGATRQVWGDQATDSNKSYVAIAANPSGKKAWQVYIRWQRVRINLGWKLWGWEPPSQHQFVMYFSAWK